VCWSSRESAADSLGYLCLRRDAPALAYATFKPGSTVQTNGLSPVIAHFDEDTNRLVYIAYHETASAVYISTVLDGDIVPSYTSDSGKLEVITSLHLLVLGLSLNSADSCEDLYGWIRAEDMSTSNVLVVSLHLEDFSWFYDLNKCEHCPPHAHWHPSWFTWRGYDAHRDRFQFLGFVDAPETP